MRITEKYKQDISPKFLYYVVSSDEFFDFDTRHAKGTKMPRGNKAAILKYKIPTPPLPVQKEIVRILDTFTELGAELGAELEARRKQYEHYRSQLLTFSEQGGVRWMALGMAGRRNHGTNMTAARMKGLHQNNGPIRIFAGGRTVADVPVDVIPKADIINDVSIIVKSRGYIGFEYYDKPFSHKNELWSYTIQDESINQKFVYFYLLTQTGLFQKKARASSVKLPQLSVADTDNFKIPIPSRDEQDRIVSILDKFDALVNDISIGLPAEIAARDKQYEHYRNRLLTFKEYAG
jgi:type I restriction enzyme S subunit